MNKFTSYEKVRMLSEHSFYRLPRIGMLLVFAFDYFKESVSPTPAIDLIAKAVIATIKFGMPTASRSLIATQTDETMRSRFPL